MSLFLDRFGVKEVGDVFKAKCVQVGFLFLLFPAIVAAPLFVLLYLKKSGRFQTPFPYAALLILFNFFAVPYCIIVFTSPGFFRFKLLPLILILIVTIGGRAMNNLCKDVAFASSGSVDRWRRHIDRIAAKLGIGKRFFGSSGFNVPADEVRGFLLRVPNLVVIACLDVWALWGVPIFEPRILWRMFSYFFYWFLIAALLWLARKGIPQAFEERDRGKGWFVTVCMGTALYYLALLAFAYGVYPFIPVAKGGGDFSATQNVILWWEKDSHESVPAILKEDSKQRHSRVLKIVEESPTLLFVADPNIESKPPASWRLWGSNLPDIVAVRRDLIQSIEYFGSNEYQKKVDPTLGANPPPTSVGVSPIPTKAPPPTESVEQNRPEG